MKNILRWICFFIFISRVASGGVRFFVSRSGETLPEKQTQARDKIAIISLTSDETKYDADMLDKVKLNRKKYCQRYNFTCITSIADLKSICGGFLHNFLHFITLGSWIKIPIISQCISRFDFLIWIDIDALIIAPNIHIIQRMFDNQCADADVVVSGNTCDSEPGINNGLIAFKNTRATENVLTRIYEESKNTSTYNHPWWEQQAMRNIIAQKNSAICVSDTELQWFPGMLCMTQTWDTFIAHWAGVEKKSKKFLDSFIKTYHHLTQR